MSQENRGFRIYLSGVLELQHAGVIVRFACSCLSGADEVTESLGHILHCVDQDHLWSVTVELEDNQTLGSDVWDFHHILLHESTGKSERHMSCPYLGLWVFRTKAGSTQFDHISQFGDGEHRGLGSLGQFLLTGSGTGHQQLGVFHQSLGCLQDVFSVHRKLTTSPSVTEEGH